MSDVKTLMTGVVLGESPRWHDDRLWFSDWGAQSIIAVDLDGDSEVVTHVASYPFCIDWLPDGRLLVVSASDRRLLRMEPDGSLVTHADLAGVSDKLWNDIVVDGRGNAYVDNIGFDFPAGEFAPGVIALVTSDGSARQVGDGLAFPNGIAVTRDNSTLIVREGSEVLATIDLDRGCFACMLGGPDRGTLFMVAAEWPAATTAGGQPTGQVLTAPAPARGAGWP